MLFEDFIKYGRQMTALGLNNSHSGNISVRKNESIYITRHGARCGDLCSSDIVRVNLSDERLDAEASVEIKVHRAIYKAVNTQAIVHAHPPYAVSLSLISEKIVPVDMEGQYYFPEIPVLYQCEKTVSSNCVADSLPRLLKFSKAAIVRGHGSFAIGENLEEAFQWTSVTESICRIICILKSISLSR